MAYCIKCGISLEIDADTEDGEVCAQCKHSYTKVFANIWQCNDCGAHAEGGSQCIKHHATCKPGESERWEKHYTEANAEEIDHLRMARWLQGNPIMLLQSDIDILDGSRNRTVRTDQMEDLQVKVLYDIWKSL